MILPFTPSVDILYNSVMRMKILVILVVIFMPFVAAAQTNVCLPMPPLGHTNYETLDTISSGGVTTTGDNCRRQSNMTCAADRIDQKFASRWGYTRRCVSMPSYVFLAGEISMCDGFQYDFETNNRPGFSSAFVRATTTAYADTCWGFTCNPGYYKGGDNKSCALCNAGNYCPGDNLKHPCLRQESGGEGWYCDENGMSARKPCPAGYYCSSYISGIDEMIDPYEYPCTTGYYCPEGSDSPTKVKCPAGYYCGLATGGIGDPNGPIECSLGYYCALGASVGTPCPAGTFCDAPGMAWPTECPSGFYCPEVSGTGPGNITPTTCPANHYCPFESVDPTPCPNDGISDAGSDALTDCSISFVPDRAGKMKLNFGNITWTMR